MTDTKTKPDGWVWRDWREFFASGLEQMFISATESQIRDTPVCLVPPALLDWCEEVEAYLSNVMQHKECDDRWYSCPLSEEGCANESVSGCSCGAEKANEERRSLLNKLKEVRG